MTSSIEPPRRSSRIHRMAQAASARSEEHEDEVDAAEATPLPIPVGPARTVPPRGPVASAAAIHAQLLGERRGLRAGATIHDQAKVTYNRTEWSGSYDRRTPKGQSTKTEI